MALCDHTPLTLPVSSLSAATPFYLSALRPLGYHLVSQVRHQTATKGSTAVGLGPNKSTRVDLFLSQSDSHPGPSRGKPAQVVFPAPSRVAVREAYTSALNAGGQTVAPPADRTDGLFNSIIADTDGNRLEIAFDPEDYNPSSQGPTTSSSCQTKSVSCWQEHVAPTTPTSMTAAHPAREAVSKASSVSSAKGDKAEHHANAVVGTLIGAAAGAALTYAVFKSKGESRLAEEKDKAEMDAKDRIKSEARAHADRGIALIDHFDAEPRRHHSTSQPLHRNTPAERDSGYYSSESARDFEPKMIRYDTWPTSRSRAEPSRSSRKLIAYATPSSAWTTPHATKERTEVSTKYPVKAVRPPSPPLPYSMERGASRNESTARSTTSTSRHSPAREGPRAFSNSSQRASQPGSRGAKEASRVDTGKSTSNFEPRAPSRAPSKTSSRRYSVVTSRAPSKSQTKAPSQAPGKSALSRASHSTNHTARRVPLPASQAPTMLSVNEMPLPPSEVDTGALDDLETVVPDDSISCAPSPPRSPVPRRSYGSSRHSSKADRPGPSNRRTGLVY